MTNMNRNNIAIIAILAYAINQPIAIYQCAAIFTAIILTVNIQLLQITVQKLYIKVFVGIMLSLPIYILVGVSNTQMVIASLVSLTSVSCLSVYITNTLQNSCKFPLALFISLLLASIIDSMIMSSYFFITNIFTIKTIINIFSREVLFKIIYAAVISTTMYLVESYRARMKCKPLISD